MPKYIIENTESGERQEILCTYEEMKAMVAENPLLRNIITCPAFIGGKSTDSGRLPDGFKDKLREIKRNTLTQAVLITLYKG